MYFINFYSLFIFSLIYYLLPSTILLFRMLLPKSDSTISSCKTGFILKAYIIKQGQKQPRTSARQEGELEECE
jgi:hypothetical protein